MTCDDVRTRLTAYLDGDLDPDRGTVIRGHLRTCDACRQASEQEAVLRDELRALPTVDPPNAMWANIQAQLAAVEISESKRPAWKRALARWTPMLPRFAMGGALAAAAVGILVWRAHDTSEPASQHKIVDVRSPQIEASSPKALAVIPTTTPTGCNLDAPAGTDVTADLASEPARVTACYAQTAAELLALTTEARGTWTDSQRASFDTQVAALQHAVDTAEDGRPRQRALRALNRFLQTTLTRDDVALASAP